MRELNDPDFGARFLVAENGSDVLSFIRLIKEGASTSGILAFDFETNALKEDRVNPLEDSILSCSFCFDDKVAYAFRLQSKNKWLYDDNVVNCIKEFYEWILNNKNIKKVIHNLKFDLKLVWRIVGKYPLVNDSSWEDTMIMAYLLDENNSVGLKRLASRYLNLDGFKYERMVLEVGKISNMSSLDWYIVSQYNCADSFMTYKLYYVLLDKMKADDLFDLYEKLCRPLLLLLLETEIIGFKLDIDYLKQKRMWYRDKLIELEREMSKIVGFNFNPRSVKQLRKVFESLSLSGKIDKFGKTGFSTDKNVLAKLSKQGDLVFVDKLLEFKKSQKISEFINGLLEKQRDGIISTNFLLNGTVTGRLSSREPNLQNLPRGAEVRRAFISRDGCKLVIADFEQIELRVASFYAKDKTMLDIFKSGGDIHSRTAIECFKLNCSEKEVKEKYPDLRVKAKGVNFGILYGLSPKSLAEYINVSIDDAKDYISRYFYLYTGIKDLIDKTRSSVIENEYVENIFGRKRRFLGLKNLVKSKGLNDEEVSSHLREAFNFLIQSTAVDICNLSIINVKKGVLENNLDAKLLVQVHDEQIWEVVNSGVERFCSILKSESEEVIGGFKTPIDLRICNSWGDKYAD